jgi:hypothetical protein
LPSFLCHAGVLATTYLLLLSYYPRDLDKDVLLF